MESGSRLKKSSLQIMTLPSSDGSNGGHRSEVHIPHSDDIVPETQLVDHDISRDSDIDIHETQAMSPGSTALFGRAVIGRSVEGRTRKEAVPVRTFTRPQLEITQGSRELLPPFAFSYPARVSGKPNSKCTEKTSQPSNSIQTTKGSPPRDEDDMLGRGTYRLYAHCYH